MIFECASYVLVPPANGTADVQYSVKQTLKVRNFSRLIDKTETESFKCGTYTWYFIYSCND